MKAAFALLCLALCASAVQSRIVIVQLQAVFHTDSWCQDHHIGEGPSTCISNSGCCYDGRIGICHSCDAHEHEWCEAYGGTDVKTCVGFAGCTMDYAKPEYPDGICQSSETDFSKFIEPEVTCEERLAEAEEAGGIGALSASNGADAEFLITYTPLCDENGEWEAEQSDPESEYFWCVDENGHEIPDTRAKERAFKSRLINCKKERKKHAGHQCPNAVTLSTGNGEVMINDHPDVGNCDMRCNTDKDCRGEGEWCCYNGCGYSCQMSIIPKADCEHLVLAEGLWASNYQEGVPTTEGGGHEHGIKVTVDCEPGWSGTDPVEIECKHGHWNEYAMECFKDCPPYEVQNARSRDYQISGGGTGAGRDEALKEAGVEVGEGEQGQGNGKRVLRTGGHHGDHVKLACQKGYGAVLGSPDAMRFYKEKLECINGAWEERTLECSACFDAPVAGPHAWWIGISDEWGPLPDFMSKQKDDEGNPLTIPVQKKHSFDCLYFSSRPLKCSEDRGARENCRISCRTCEFMLMKFKVKKVMDSIATVPHDKRHRKHWMKARLRNFNAKPGEMLTKYTLQKIAVRQKKPDY